jgi:Protein of unknown function (DUF3800)
MFMAYFDESGDSGLIKSPTRFFVLSCVLVHQDHWLSTLDRLIDMRRQIKKQHGVSTRPEIKATDMRRGRGPLLDLRWSLERRMAFYRDLMRFQAVELTDIACFSIAIEKAPAFARRKEDIRETAWTYAMQRVDRFCKENNDKAMIFPDEGHGRLVKTIIRRMRRHHRAPRHFGSGSISVPTERIIEDPNDRQSHDSYFIQLADWNAFACHRSQYVDPKPHVPDDLWDELGDCRLLAVNKVTGGPPGIVVYPTA